MSQSPVFTPEELESARRGLESAEQLRDSQLKSEKAGRPGGHGGPGGPPRAPIPGQASAPFKQTMGKLLAYLRPVLPGMVVAIVAAVIGVVLTIVAPQFLSAITDEIQKGFTGQLDMGEIYRLMWISIGMLVASLILSLVEGQIMARSTVWVSRSMRMMEN